MAAVYDIVSMDNGMVLSCAKYQTERLGGIGGTGIGDNEGAKGGGSKSIDFQNLAMGQCMMGGWGGGSEALSN